MGGAAAVYFEAAAVIIVLGVHGVVFGVRCLLSLV